MKKLLALSCVLSIGIAGSAYACDAGDGRWTNCPDPQDEGNNDPLFDVILNIDLAWLRSFAYVPTPSAVCSSPSEQKLAYAQVASSYIFANGLDPYFKQNMEYARIQYPDGTYEIFAYKRNPATHLVYGNGSLEQAPNTMQGYMTAEQYPYRCRR